MADFRKSLIAPRWAYAESQPLLRSWEVLRGLRVMRNGDGCTGGGSAEKAFAWDEYIYPGLWSGFVRSAAGGSPLGASASMVTAGGGGRTPIFEGGMAGGNGFAEADCGCWRSRGEQSCGCGWMRW